MTQNYLKLINKAFNNELFAFYQYFYLASLADEIGCSGTAEFFREHSKEEHNHAEIVYNYMVSSLEYVPQFEQLLNKQVDIKSSVFSIKTIFKSALKQEEYLFEFYKQLLKYIQTEKEKKFVLSMIEEQIREINLFSKIVENLSNIMDEKAILNFDKNIMKFRSKEKD